MYSPLLKKFPNHPITPRHCGCQVEAIKRGLTYGAGVSLTGLIFWIKSFAWKLVCPEFGQQGKWLKMMMKHGKVNVQRALGVTEMVQIKNYLVFPGLLSMLCQLIWHEMDSSWLICVLKLTVAVTNLNAAPLRLHTIPELHSRQGIQPHVHQWHGEIREVRITCPLVSGLSLSDEKLSQLLGALHILWAKIQKPSKKATVLLPEEY